MRRSVVVSAVLLAGLSSASPAAVAEDAQKGIRVGARVAGVIATTTSLAQLAGGSQSGNGLGYEAAGACAYVAAITPNNRMTIQMVGNSASTGTKVPMLTVLKCDVETALGNTAAAQIACSGNVCQVVGSTPQWQIADVKICVSTSTVYGPTPLTTVSTDRVCESIF